MDGDTAHSLEEFANFPWHRMDEAWFNTESYYHEGGITAGIDFNGPPMRPHVSFWREEGTDLICDRWEIPTQLKQLLDVYRERGRRELKDEFRNLMGPFIG